MATQGLSPVELEKIHAAISKLIDESIKLNDESSKFRTETSELIAEASKLNAVAGKFTRETFWYPMAVVTGLYGAMAVIMAVIFKLLH